MNSNTDTNIAANSSDVTKLRVKVLEMLRSIRLSNMANALAEDWENPNCDLACFDDRILNIVSSEYNARQDRKRNKYIKSATMKLPGADLSDLDKSFDRTFDMEVLTSLSTCEWIRQKKNLIITGPCGCGKTWIGNALGIKACEIYMRVRYYSCNQLLLRLHSYNQDPNLYLHQLQDLASLDLLILDDVGLQSYDLDSCRIFFEIMETRYKVGSMMLISQFPVKEWHDLFSDKTFANSILSRTVENSYRLPISGEDIRARH